MALPVRLLDCDDNNPLSSRGGRVLKERLSTTQTAARRQCVRAISQKRLCRSWSAGGDRVMHLSLARFLPSGI